MPLNTSHSSSSDDRFIFYGFLALLVWIPLPLGSNRPWAWHLMELLSFSLVAWWIVQLSRGKLTVPAVLKNSQGLLGCLSLFALVIALQLVPLPVGLVAGLRSLEPLVEPNNWVTMSIDPQITWIHLRTTLCFIALAFLTLALINTKERLKWLAITLLVSGVFQALYGSIMTLSGAEYGFFIKKGGFWGVSTGTFWNRNNYANYLTLCIAAGTGLLLSDLYQKSSKGWRERGRRILTTLLGSKVRVRIGLAMMVVALVLTKSRMGNTAFFFSLLVTGFCWLWLTKRITRGSIILLVSLVVIDSLIVGAWFGIDKVAERLETTAFTKETRDEVNRDTWTMIKDQPLFGSGAGSYYTAFPRYHQEDIPIYYDHAHNDYFEFLAEHGVIGCLPLLVLIILTLKTAAQTMRQRKTLLFQAMAFAPMMATIALLLHSTVDFNLQIPANAATFVVLIALAWVVRYMPSKAGGKQR